MTKTIKHILKQSEYRTRLAQALIGACAILTVIYSINLYSIVWNTVAIQRVNKDAQALAAGIETLDGQYLTLSSKVTPDSLKTFGLEKGTVSYFISRGGSSLGRVAMSGHEL